MAKPWENYAKPPEVTSEGPWSKYQNESGPQPGEPRRTEAMAMGAFTGLADVLGAPTDIVNVGLEQVGLGTEKPFGGSEYLKEQLQSIGHGYTNLEQIPERHRPYAVMGETFGANLPFAAAPYAIPAKTTSTLLRGLTEFARTNPGKYLTTEMLLSTLSGVGGGIAEELAPGDPLIRLGGELAMPFAVPGNLLVRSSGLVGHQIRNIRAKMSRAGKEEAAAEALQNEMKSFNDDINKAVANLQERNTIPGEYLLSGKKSRSPVLIALQQKYIKQNPYLDEKAKKALQQTLNAYKRAAIEAINGGDETALKELGFLQRQLYLDSLAQQVQTAAKEAAKSAEKIRPRGLPLRLSERARSTLEEAYSDARLAEQAVWGEVPNDIELAPNNIENLSSAYDDLRKNRLLDEENLPAPIEAFMRRIDRFLKQGEEDITGGDLAVEARAFMSERQPEVEPEIITTGDLQRFRSRVLQMQRGLRDSDKGMADMLGQLADAVLDDFGSLGIIENLDDARAFSYQLNNLFTRGEVGNILGYNYKGDVKVQPGMTLERAIGGGGTEAAIGSQQVERAAQLHGLDASPRRTTMGEQEEFIKNLSNIVDPNTGRISPNALDRFVANNKELLNRFPVLRTQIKDAASAERLLKDIEKSTERATKQFENKSLFAKLINTEDPSKVIGSIIRGKTPVQEYTTLINAAKNAGPETVDGLRQATFDYIFDQSLKGDMLSAREIVTRLNFKPNRQSESLLELMGRQGVISKQQLENLEKVLTKMSQLEHSMEQTGQIGLVLDDPNMLEDLIARLIGSNLAGSSLIAQNTGSSLLMAHAGSRWARQILNHLPIEQTHKIIEEAIENPQFMAALLTKGQTAGAKRMVEHYVNAYLWGAGTRFIEKEKERKEKRIPRGEPVYHTGGIVKNYGKIAANLEKMSDINRKRHLTNMFKKNRDEFDRLFDYLGGNS